MFFLVSGLLTNISNRLETATYREISLLWGLKAEVGSLQNSLRIISAFLVDAENKQTQSHSIMEWLQQLKDAFLDARDILDEIECEALRNQVVRRQGSFTRKVQRFFSLSNPLAFRIRMAHKIKDIKGKIDAIASFRMKLGLSEIHACSNDHVPLNQKLAWRETYSYVRPSHVIGRDEEKEKIIGSLMVPPSDGGNEIDVIPIVGIGGLGKTTLAQLVYNDDRVIEHFNLRMWVFVSDDFDVKRLALEILKAMHVIDVDAHHSYSFDRLQNLLHEGLHGKKFLLVLDDVWNEDYRGWSELRDLLVGMHDDENNKIGNKVIVTTRSDKVASIMGKAYKHNLRYLPEEDCLKLFLKCAFPAGEENQHPRLVEIGKEIVRKCKGLPLAVVSLGRLLYSKPQEGVWKKIRDSEIWKMDQQDDGILAALKLSYNHLPSELKRCFSYCSVFPKGYEYTNLELISFWMAHGLLQTKNEDEEPEDLGEFYIQELVSRSFFEGVPEDQVVVDGLIFEELKHLGISFFKMHDLINDLAVFTMQNERAVVKFNSTNVKERVQHLSFSESAEGVPTFGKMLNKVQTIGFWHAGQSASAITEPFLKWISKEFRYLRVLNIQGSNIQFLPDCFNRMKHLRYLNLSYCQRMEKLPDSICKLQNLEVLNLCRCVALKNIPKNLRDLVSLRILWITTQVTDLSSIGFESFKSLQILILWNCENLAFLPHDLRHLTALKRLSVEACLEVTHFEDQGEEENEDYSLKLEQFSINELPKLAALPGWLRRSAKTLRYMGLSQCQDLTAFPEWLPSLTSLETLLIADCPNLTLPQNMDCLHNLQNLKIFGCPQLVERCKRDTGPDWCKIAHIPNVEAHSNLQKRRSTLITEGNAAAFKKRRSRTASYVDSLERKQPEDDLTIEEKYSEDEDNNEVDDNTDEEKAEGDEDAVDDNQEDAEYLLGDEGPRATEEELHDGLLPKDVGENNKPSTRHFSHGCHSTEGKMNHAMEDYIFAQHRKLNGYDLGLYAIFDGHSGRDVAKYLQSHLFENILSEPDFWKNPMHAVKRACKATDDEIIENVADSRGGSTAVAAILINGVKLLVANVGDSRAISFENGIAKQITVDHEPEKEKDLVESRGGFVSKKPGSIPRVDGQLAMTRAFGDIETEEAHYC